MLPQPTIDAAREIGRFYLDKFQGNYEKAAEELLNVRITKVEIQGDKLCITASRVGLLIGRRGQNIDALSKWIEDKLHMKVHIYEDTDCLYDYLIPTNYRDLPE